MRKELTAAGITDPGLVRAYSICRRLNAEHGKTYYLATLLLPPAKRPFVHSLYGFARYADEIVDAFGERSVGQRRAALDRLGTRLFRAMDAGGSSEPVVAAVVDTAARWGIPREHFEAFLHSMAMDLTVTAYETFEDLNEYVYGSAAVIGLQMLPILEPSDTAVCAEGARRLGVAFQLANFIRDVAEDLDRGRIYLPLAELRRHGVTPQTLQRRVVDDDLRSALDEQIDRVRQLSDAAAPTIALLHPAVRDTIEAARVLYCGIADEVAAIDYQVFARRATVGLDRRLRVAGRHWVAAVRARRRSGSGFIPPARPVGASGAVR
jgi:phytoene synthase